jgi:hypothetical protein
MQNSEVSSSKNASRKPAHWARTDHVRVVDRSKQPHFVERVLFLFLVQVADLDALQRVVLAVFPFHQQLLSFDLPHG